MFLMWCFLYVGCYCINTIVKCQIQLEVLLPGFLVVKISWLKYSGKLGTDQLSVL